MFNFAHSLNCKKCKQIWQLAAQFNFGQFKAGNLLGQCHIGPWANQYPQEASNAIECNKAALYSAFSLDYNFGLGWSEGIVSPNFVGIVGFRF